MSETFKAVVIGGGIAGLCAAFYLRKRFGSNAVRLLEASDYAGGHVRTTRISGFSCDWGPNGFLDREPKTLEWASDLGIRAQLVHANEAAARRFILKNDRLHEIKPPPAFLASPILSPSGRARLLCEPLIPTKKNDAPESVWDFAARRIGRDAADMLVGPMVTGIFGGDAHQLSLEHCFPKMAAMEREYGSLFKALMAKKKQNSGASPMGPAGVLTSFTDGIGVFAEMAAAQLREITLLNFRVTKLQREGGVFRVRASDGSTVNAENAIVASPAYAASEFVRELDSDLSQALASIAYANIVVVCTGYPRDKVGHDMKGFGFLVPRNQGKRVLGCLWTSSLFPQQAPKDWVMLRTLFGGYLDPSSVDLTDEELMTYVRREIHPLLRIDSAPEFVQIFRHRRGIPQYLLTHGKALEATTTAEQKYPGLIFAGNAYRGVGLNDCVLSAHRAVTSATAPKSPPKN